MSTLISDVDFHVLQETISHDISNRKFLKKLMERIKVVREEFLPKTTVRLNSLVLVWHSFLQKTVSIRIVSPDRVDLGNKNISVFAPISMALLGYQENDSVRVSIGGIKKELKIIKVTNL